MNQTADVQNPNRPPKPWWDSLTDLKEFANKNGWLQIKANMKHNRYSYLTPSGNIVEFQYSNFWELRLRTIDNSVWVEVEIK